MVDVIDLLQCPVCHSFYKPETTATGRMIPHCRLPVEHGLSRGQLVEQAAIEMDFSAIERRIIDWYRLTGAVVDPPLTGTLLDIEV